MGRGFLPRGREIWKQRVLFGEGLGDGRGRSRKKVLLRLKEIRLHWY